MIRSPNRPCVKTSSARGFGVRSQHYYSARRHCGVRLRELAVAAGGLNYGSVAVVIQRFEKQLKSGSQLRQHYATIKHQLLQC
jgi:hypothetical protein